MINQEQIKITQVNIADLKPAEYNPRIASDLNEQGINVIRVKESEKSQIIIDRWEKFAGKKAKK